MANFLSDHINGLFSTMYAVIYPLNIAKMSNGHSGHQAPTTHATNSATNGSTNGLAVHVIGNPDSILGNINGTDRRNSCKATEVDEMGNLYSRDLPALPNTVSRLHTPSVHP